MELLRDALLNLTKQFDWEAWHRRLFPDRDPSDTYIIVANSCAVPRDEYYGWFHRQLDDTAKTAKLLDQCLSARTDQNRVYFAELYAQAVLEVTDLADAEYFRRGIVRKENLPATSYHGHRDHAVHTVHNYLLGWYFLVHSSSVHEAFRTGFDRRGLATASDSDIISSFGSVWCFVSLLHDIGYLFEGAVPNSSMGLIDQGMRYGANWTLEYFQDLFWRELEVRGPKERNRVSKFAGLEQAPVAEFASPQAIAQFLRNLGDLEVLMGALKAEETKSRANAKSSFPFIAGDSFDLWAANYRAFDQEQMAVRMEGLQEAFDHLLEKGIPPKDSVRVLDHGVCGGLLLLKYSTLWFQLIFALKRRKADRTDDDGIVSDEVSWERKLADGIEAKLEGFKGYYADHWWSSVVWATAAVAIHNVQQNDKCPGWKGRLELSEDPLAYLGVLVDILQEWDRHSTRKHESIESGDQIIESDNVRIGPGPNGVIAVQYGCRAEELSKREDKLRKDLDAALVDWNRIVDVSFRPI